MEKMKIKGVLAPLLEASVMSSIFPRVVSNFFDVGFYTKNVLFEL